MATYDDYDGVYFSIQALRMYHEMCNTDDVEYVVIDNNPTSNSGKTTKEFITKSLRGNGKYIKETEQVSSFNKYKVAEHATGKYVIIIDCHVLLVQNSISKLLDYYADNRNCKDLIQGPLVYDDLENISTHFDPQWRGHMYGTWATDHKKYGRQQPFEIQLQGMGACSFERRNWPKISQHFKGFGGEEGYISEKFRRNGGKNICLPQFKWVHRFGRPLGAKFPLILEDRIWNYFVGWLEITQDPEHEMIKGAYDHFKNEIPEGSIDNILSQARQTIGV